MNKNSLMTPFLLFLLKVYKQGIFIKISEDRERINWTLEKKKKVGVICL